MSSPSIVTLLLEGHKTPAITLNKVVFPAPLGPISPVIDPFLISKEAPSTAQKPPKYFSIFVTVIMLRCPYKETAQGMYLGLSYFNYLVWFNDTSSL